MDGLLIVDKPSGPTSHDVVARLRRVLREKRIGHTGTLDPLATGVLVLVVGKATRLAKFLSASDKSYDAIVRFGFATDTADGQGRPIGPVVDGAAPPREVIDAALDAFRGTFLQQPPAFSAKKIDGQRSYKLARGRANARLKPSRYESHPPALPALPTSSALPALPAPPADPAPPALPAAVSVTAHSIEIVSVDANTVTLRVDCSAGFYVRSLAHDLGQRLGVGAHLAALRRTRVGDIGLTAAISLDEAERDPQRAAAALVPLAGMLPRVPAATLTAEGVARALHGRDIGPNDIEQGLGLGDSGLDHSSQPLIPNHESLVRMMDTSGRLIAIGRRSGAAGLLHPSIVLV
jgi:tRNA pseudouridine55 synthase